MKKIITILIISLMAAMSASTAMAIMVSTEGGIVTSERSSPLFGGALNIAGIQDGPCVYDFQCAQGLSCLKSPVGYSYDYRCTKECTTDVSCGDAGHTRKCEGNFAGQKVCVPRFGDKWLGEVCLSNLDCDSSFGYFCNSNYRCAKKCTSDAFCPKFDLDEYVVWIQCQENSRAGITGAAIVDERLGGGSGTPTTTPTTTKYCAFKESTNKVLVQCRDGKDNDCNGKIDYVGRDPGCYSDKDVKEGLGDKYCQATTTPVIRAADTNTQLVSFSDRYQWLPSWPSGWSIKSWTGRFFAMLK